MFLASLRSSAARFAAVTLAGLLLAVSASAQVALGTGTYTQNFDTLASGLPTGWSIYTAAGATALGTPATLNVTPPTWASTTGQWANMAAADNNGTPFVGTETNTVQNASTDRALAIRQTGSFGDPGASANFYFSTAGQQVTAISFKAQMLSVQTRSTTWSLQYGLGATPASWTTIATFADPAAFGTTVVNGAGFGTALDNQSQVWLRVVALAASTGSGNRDSFGLDDFTITTIPASGPPPPSIDTPPASQTVTEGADVTFHVAANGPGPLTYQWRKGLSNLGDTGNISGALTDTLTLTGVAVSDSGSYDVVVTNAGGSVPSTAATLTVNPALIAPAITIQPTPQSTTLGGVATFTVTASGTAPLAYQWRKGGVPLADGDNIFGATSSALTINPVGAADVGSYDVVVSNAAPTTATSNSVALALSAFVTPTGLVSYAGGAYTQNFDTLPSSGTFTLASAGPLALSAAPINASGLGGWSLAKYAGSGSVALFRVEAGTGTSGSVYSYGAASAGDRALGTLSSGTTVPRFGVVLTNSTGLPITEFTLSYTGEQWRRGSAAANKLTFEYAVGGTDINNGTFVAAPSLDFTAPNNTGTNTALVGNAPGNFAAVNATVTGLAWAPGQTLVLRWTDVDDSGSDDGLAVDDLSFSTPVATSAIIPSVVYATPAGGAVNVATSTAPTVTFNEGVNFPSSAVTLTGETSGAHAVSVTGGPVAYTVTPTAPFVEGETVTLTIAAAQVTDAATGAVHPGGDFTTSFVTFSSGPLAIHKIQGSGATSAYAGYPVTVQGVVVASYQAPGQVGGYYVEAPDAEQDADAATSEGIYVFDNANPVAVGDLVSITGTVSEFGTAPNTQTELSALTAFTKVSGGNPLPTPVTVTLPFPSAGYQERYEGMLVNFPQTLTVNDNYDLGHFGEITLANGRLPTPTNIVAPGAAAQAQEAANLLNQVTLDDGLSTTSPSPTPFLTGTTPATQTLRAGSTTTGLTGILDNKFGLYVVEPTGTPVFADANPRLDSPTSTGSLRVVIGNVENFMNGDGMGGGFPTSRGATTYEEYQRQLAKVTAAILNLAPDIMGLTEVENDRMSNGEPDSYGPTSAIAQLVASLNANAPAGTTYGFVNAAPVDITTDVIHVALIYRKETVEEAGVAAMLNDPAFNNLARNPLAQTFRQKSTGSKLTVCINHFRAKASAASGAGNADSGDGQGTNNALRVQEADALTAWLATSPTGDTDPDVLVIGDLNAYAKEDPIAHIEGAGYTNLSELYEGVGGYSYAFAGEFGHLDHALASPGLLPQVHSTATWHVNSDEPVYYDYNLEDKDAAQQAINAGTPYRYSDHDCVVIGIELDAAPAIVNPPTPQVTTTGTSVTFSVTASGSPAPTYQWRKNGLALLGATGSTFTIANPTSADAGSYDVVVTNSVGSVTSTPVTLTVNPAVANVVLTGLTQVYDGSPKSVTAATTPAGLPVTITYNGSPTPPTAPGWYTVVAAIDSPDYTGSVTDQLFIDVTALVRHLPTLDGKLRGSIQVTTAENITLNGNAGVTGDLLVPGLPTVKKNGSPTYGGTIDGTDATTPATATITLNGGSSLRHVVRRTAGQTLVTVPTPPAPTGTRNVSLNTAGQSPGDFATIRNLTLNGNAGQLALPAGTYGSLTANGNSSFVLGVAGATTPSVYNLQGLTLNGTSRLVIVGPVVINLASGTALNGSAGATSHPDWLDLNIASGGLTLNGTIAFVGYVTAPSGTVTINGGSVLTGRITADRLTVNGSGVLADPEF